MKPTPPTISALLKNDTPWKEFYWGANLPHWQPKNAVLFITSRLAGSLPKSVIENLQNAINYEIAKLKNEQLGETEIKKIISQKQEFYFNKFDKLLDKPRSGPTWLAKNNLAKIVKNSLHWGEKDGRYKLICYTIMSNHIHWIAYKFDRELFRILQSLKRHTSKECNRVLGRTGEQFWQYENYDRWIRHKEELFQKINYVVQNPVKAGLVKNWSEWPHTWIRPEFRKFLLEHSMK